GEPGFALEGRLRADREDDRILHEIGKLRSRVGEGLFLFIIVEDVPLRDDEDDLVPRRLEELVVQELALALLEDLAGVEEEEDRVGPRNVAVGDVRSLERQIVHAWRVDEQDALLEERRGVADLEEVHLLRVRSATDGELARVVEADRLAL